MAENLFYKILDTIDAQHLIAEITGRFPIKAEAPGQLRQRYFDSYDWRIYRRGLVLFRQQDEFILAKHPTELVVARTTVDSGFTPRFWWDFPDGALRTALKNCLDVRALIPLVDIEKQVNCLRILNRDEKTVVRVCVETIDLVLENSIPKLATCLRLLPVRGYDQECADFKNWLIATGLGRETEPVLLLALKAIGRKAGDYSSRLSFTLEPRMPARQAMIVILKFLLGVMQQNEQGIREDIDTEFLHDFRVAIRRTRSALSQLKGIFPDKVQDQFRKQFSALQKVTNRNRDLDVYLLKKEIYQQMLPDYLRPGLEPLLVQIDMERQKEHQKVVQQLDSDSYQGLMKKWETFLDGAESLETTRNANIPVIELAKKFITRAYQRVLKKGTRLNEDSPDADWHQLRIACKKLRYLTEFFASLFPPDGIGRFVKQLKNLQNSLGNYNDLSVQQQDLKTFLESISPRTKDGSRVAAALGGLLTSLQQQQQAIRKSFTRTFQEFRTVSSRLEKDVF